MIRWMSGVKVTERLMCSELRERLQIGDIIQRYSERIRWHGHVLRKVESDWVKKCIDSAVEGVRHRGRPKKTLSDVTGKDYQTRQICNENAMDCTKTDKDQNVGQCPT